MSSSFSTKLKGDIGEMIAAEAFLREGWHVAFPVGENLQYDLIIEKDGQCQRVQVKAVTPKNGVLHVNCRSSNNWSVIHYGKDCFELLAAVDLESRKVYFIPSKNLGKNLLDLRLSPTKNKQSKGINLAESFCQIAIN